MKTTTGFLLSFYKYGDYDAVLHCYTLENGFQSFFVKGIYASKNRKKSYLLPFIEILVTYNEKNKKDLLPITKIELSSHFNLSVYEDVKTASIIFFAADFLHQILKNEQNNEKLYYTIKNFIQHVNLKNNQSHLLLFTKILKILGISPAINEGKYLNFETGNFTDMLSFECFPENISAVWKIVLKDSHYETEVAKSLRKDFLDSILKYYQQHFPDFKTPKSLEILTQIFE